MTTVAAGDADLSDVRLHYLRARAEAGPVVLLLHGWGFTSYMWRHVMPVLAGSFDVLAPDLRGFGDSGKPAGGYDVATVAADLGELLDVLGIDTAAVVGHDWGSPVGYALAATSRDRVTRLALIEVALPGVAVDPGTLGDRLWHPAFHAVPELPEALVTGRERVYLTHFYRQYAVNRDAFTEADIDEYVRTYGAPDGLRGGFGYFRAWQQDAEIVAGLASSPLPMPVLAVGGDSMMADISAATMRKVAVAVTAVSIPRCGHWVPEERPAELLSHLVPFLKGGA